MIPKGTRALGRGDACGREKPKERASKNTETSRIAKKRERPKPGESTLGGKASGGNKTSLRLAMGSYKREKGGASRSSGEEKDTEQNKFNTLKRSNGMKLNLAGKIWGPKGEAKFNVSKSPTSWGAKKKTYATLD